jgi:hypothetical protein
MRPQEENLDENTLETGLLAFLMYIVINPKTMSFKASIA